MIHTSTHKLSRDHGKYAPHALFWVRCLQYSFFFACNAWMLAGFLMSGQRPININHLTTVWGIKDVNINNILIVISIISDKNLIIIQQYNHYKLYILNDSLGTRQLLLMVEFSSLVSLYKRRCLEIEGTFPNFLAVKVSSWSIGPYVCSLSATRFKE